MIDEFSDWDTSLTSSELDSHALFSTILSQVALREYPDVSPLLLDAFRAVPRPLFLPKPLRASLRSEALHLPVAIPSLSTRLAPPLLHLISLHALQLRSDTSCLDVGCGTGYVAALLSSICTAAPVIGIDLSPRLIDLANALLPHFAPTDETNHPQRSCSFFVQNVFDDFLLSHRQSFDRIYVGASCHVSLVPRLARLLSPSGRMVVVVGKTLTLLTKNPSNALNISESLMESVEYPEITVPPFVTVSCPNGHRMPPSTSRRPWTCKQCAAQFTGVRNRCNRCSFQLCAPCVNRFLIGMTAARSDRCPAGHVLQLSQYAEGGYAEGWLCDRCDLWSAVEDCQRWFCIECGYDVCCQCRPNPNASSSPTSSFSVALKSGVPSLTASSSSSNSLGEFNSPINNELDTPSLIQSDTSPQSIQSDTSPQPIQSDTSTDSLSSSSQIPSTSTLEINPSSSTSSSSSSFSSTSSNDSDMPLLPRIAYEDLKIDRMHTLGRGAGGVVFAASWAGIKVAVKVVYCTPDDKELETSFLQECALLARVTNHPAVISFLGCCVELPNLCLVSQYCAHGSLWDFLIKRRQQVDWRTKIRMLRDTASGISHLHAQNIIHRDIAARNVLVDEQLNCYVTDFGMARVKEICRSYGKTKSTIGPVKWYVH